MCERPLEEIEQREYKIAIYPDMTPEDPRNWDNLGFLLLDHPRYNLPWENHHVPKGLERDEIVDYVRKNCDAPVVLPVRFYEAGYTVRLEVANGHANQVGVIYATRADIKREYGCQRISPQIKRIVTKVLIGELESYRQYIAGEIYGYLISRYDKIVDSCWGYYGYKECVQAAQEALENIIKHYDALQSGFAA